MSIVPLEMAESNTSVLAVASGGGHWVQLLRLMPAFERCSITFVSVDRACAEDVPGRRFFAVPDATRWNPLRVLATAFCLLVIFVRERPDVVVSTGAAPGFLAVRIAKLFRKRTVWIDSIANVERLSASGEKAGPVSDLWLTQWPHLALKGGPSYQGSVM